MGARSADNVTFSHNLYLHIRVSVNVLDDLLHVGHKVTAVPISLKGLHAQQVVGADSGTGVG